MNNNACSPLSTRVFTALSNVGEIQRDPGKSSPRISIARISGITATPKRAGRSRRVYFPASALLHDSSDGVAEASTTCAPQIEARKTAMSRAL